VSALGAVLIGVLIIAMTSTVDLTMLVGKRMATQNAADAAAVTVAVWQARGLNSITYTNYLAGGLLLVYAVQVFCTHGAALWDFPPIYLEIAWKSQDVLAATFPTLGIVHSLTVAQQNHADFGVGIPQAMPGTVKVMESVPPLPAPFPLHASRYDNPDEDQYKRMAETAERAEDDVTDAPKTTLDNGGISFTRRVPLERIRLKVFPGDAMDCNAKPETREKDWGLYFQGEAYPFTVDEGLVKLVKKTLLNTILPRFSEDVGAKPGEGKLDEPGWDLADRFRKGVEDQIAKSILGRELKLDGEPIPIAEMSMPGGTVEVSRDPLKVTMTMVPKLTLDVYAVHDHREAKDWQHTSVRCYYREHYADLLGNAWYIRKSHLIPVPGGSRWSVHDGFVPSAVLCAEHTGDDSYRRACNPVPYYDGEIYLAVSGSMKLNMRFEFGLFYKKTGLRDPIRGVVYPQERAWGYAQTAHRKNALLLPAAEPDERMLQGIAEAVCYSKHYRERASDFLLWVPDWNAGFRKYSPERAGSALGEFVQGDPGMMPEELRSAVSDALDALGGLPSVGSGSLEVLANWLKDRIKESTSDVEH